MKFDPLSEEQLETQALVPEGIYSYQVIQAEDKVSKAGNDYISLTIKVWQEAGNDGCVFTNLALIKLLKHFCDVNQLQDRYNSGEVPASICRGKSGGRVMIGIEGEKPNPTGGFYKEKNIVKDYIIAPAGSLLNPMKPLPAVKSDFDDCTDIPF